MTRGWNGDPGMFVPSLSPQIEKPPEKREPAGPLMRPSLMGGPYSSRSAALCKLQELRSIEG